MMAGLQWLFLIAGKGSQALFYRKPFPQRYAIVWLFPSSRFLQPVCWFAQQFYSRCR